MLSLGVLDELLPVFPVSGEVVPTGPDRELSETCAVVDACLLPPRPGDAGTGRSTYPRRDMP